MQVRVNLSDELLMLDEFLCSEAVSDESMLLSEADGFFAGLNFYATPVEPDEWLPWVWNGEAPRFEDEAQAEAVTQALLALHDDVFRRLERGEWGRSSTPILTKALCGKSGSTASGGRRS